MTVAICLFCASALLSAAGAFGQRCETQVQPALERLLGKQSMGWAFVIILHPASESFVQYGLADSAGIFVDLPVGDLSLDERQRASALFAAAGVESPVEAGAPKPEDETAVFTTQTFQLTFEQRTKEASLFACRVLHEVYRIPEDAALVLREDS